MSKGSSVMGCARPQESSGWTGQQRTLRHGVDLSRGVIGNVTATGQGTDDVQAVMDAPHAYLHAEPCRGRQWKCQTTSMRLFEDDAVAGCGACTSVCCEGDQPT